MKRILLGLAAVLVVAIGVVLAVAATRPDQFTVMRSLRIKAPPAKLAAMVADFHAWPSWSPYEKLDPAMKRGFDGPASGKGAIYTWQSEAAGSGRMEILDSTPQRILIQLDFTKPIEAHNLAEFGFAPDGDGTVVTWEMRGPVPYLFRIVHMFVNVDRMVGADFETGLSNMKIVAEI